MTVVLEMSSDVSVLSCACLHSAALADPNDVHSGENVGTFHSKVRLTSRQASDDTGFGQ